MPLLKQISPPWVQILPSALPLKSVPSCKSKTAGVDSVIHIKYELYNFDAKIRKKRASTNAEALQKM